MEAHWKEAGVLDDEGLSLACGTGAGTSWWERQCAPFLVGPETESFLPRILLLGL